MNNLNGLYDKYVVTKADGTPVYDRCFVLKPSKDPVAVKALQAYAFATDDDQLRDDLYAWVGRPTVEFEPVRHGRWIAQDETFTRFMCSACVSKNHKDCSNYCPMCGAKMYLEVSLNDD